LTPGASYFPPLSLIRQYEDGEEVVLWMNTVGPYHNRQETYSYFTLPFCRGPKKAVSHYHESMGEALQGTELEFSGIEINFRENKPTHEYCSIHLDKSTLKVFKYAIKHHYWYQMYLDDLPAWALVGDYGEGHTEEKPQNPDDVYIFTHRRIEIGVHDDQIVDFTVVASKRAKLVEGDTLHFTVQVEFKPSEVEFEKRFEKYLDPTFFQHRIHWFSIFNSFMMVLFLVGLVFMILMRTLRKDIGRYGKTEDLDEMEKDLGDEYGWKLVHGDVFRPPIHSLLLSSLVGNGYHIGAVAAFVSIIASLGTLYMERGSMISTVIFVYAATTPISGFFGGSTYARFGGKDWIKQTIVTASLLPFTVCTVVFLINFIAIYYRATKAIPFTTMILVVCIYLFVILPLTLVGSVLGRNVAGTIELPCRVNPFPRPIPEKKWFMEPWVIVLAGGLLPFGSIFIEMYFVFTSFWAYKIYYVYGFMLLVFLILVVVTMSVTVVCCYLLLNSEDYRWHWTSFLAAASTSIYVYLYSIYYFFFKTKMYGMLQTTYYFGYSALFALGLGILCGSFGYAGADLFVKKIYRLVKLE